MKKIIIVLINLILCLGLLTGCFMYDTSGTDNINPNPDIDNPNLPVNPDKPENIKLYSGSISAMNTVINFSMYASSKDAANQVYNRIKAIYLQYDEVADDGFDSVFGQSYDSELAKLNRDRYLKKPSKALLDLVMFADQMMEETNGYFNPYLGDLNHMWKKYVDGIGAKPSEGEQIYYTGIAKNTHYEYKDDVLYLIGEGNIDLGGVAKGYATQRVYDYLIAANVKHFLLNAGNSNIVVGEKIDKSDYSIGVSYVFGYPNKTPKLEIKDGTFHIDGVDTMLKSNQKVNLRYGDSLDMKASNGDIFFLLDSAEYFRFENGAYKLMGTLPLTTINTKNMGVCTSSPGEQHKKGDRHTHHLINPFTGAPANIRDSVTILGPDSGRLDAYSTAIYSMSDEEAIKFMSEHNISGLLTRDNKVYYKSEGL